MKCVSKGVPGPGRKLSVCSMLKDEMETSEGGVRETPNTIKGENKNIHLKESE